MDGMFRRKGCRMRVTPVVSDPGATRPQSPAFSDGVRCVQNPPNRIGSARQRRHAQTRARLLSPLETHEPIEAGGLPGGSPPGVKMVADFAGPVLSRDPATFELFVSGVISAEDRMDAMQTRR